MKKYFFRKGLAICTILLFVTTCFFPIINGLQVSNEENSKHQEKTVNPRFLNEKINFWMKFGHLPSLVVCIVKDNEVIWSNGFGFYDGKNVTDENTAYLIASISKTITATAMMQIIENDSYNVELDDDVNDFLDFNLRNPKYPGIPITFKMLLTHRSGIIRQEKSDFQNNNPPDTLIPLSSWVKDYFESNSDIWKDYCPGRKVQYSNLAYTLLGYLVEKITNVSFDTYCKENIFQPLGMLNTSFNRSELNCKIAVPYTWIRTQTPHLFSGFGRGIYVPLEASSDKEYPAGDLRTTTSDLSKFLIAQMNKGEYNGSIILKEETVNEMQKVYSKSLPYTFGIGWQITANLFGKIKTIGHDGGTWGWMSNMRFKPSDKIGVILFTNRMAGDFRGLFAFYHIKDILFREAARIGGG